MVRIFGTGEFGGYSQVAGALVPWRRAAELRIRSSYPLYS